MSDKLKNLIVRAVTGVFFVTAMVLGILHPHALIVLFALITGLSIWEYTGLVNNIKGVKVNRFISTIIGVYFFLAVAGLRLTPVEGFVVFVPYILSILYLLISELYLKNENPINSWAYTMLGQMYIAMPFSMINVLAFQQIEPGQVTFDYLLPLSIFIFLWTNDTGAYLCGSLFGKHKLFPRISPKKSWEGSIGGGLLVLIVAGVIGYFTNTDTDPHMLSIPAWIGLGLVVVVFGTWGDLVESLFKRTLGIKDSGNILPGHGGMLDRFDSSLMAIPAAVVYLYTLTLF
ncbi:phosphatidate cytidylyltransferase [Prevotella melaninogenica]|uniref:Phosphatidate cytidylyltransferase n=1 Tax=Prevotella melaninogenica TaxID=28132 RepID=A0A250KHQ2_9BACT|nr:phosphatidate cytidylyltransferase [Prevotella melaninogenica]BBA29122.1 phosphatidate cytidylyltransferase [Prevotella melaninogenica]